MPPIEGDSEGPIGEDDLGWVPELPGETMTDYAIRMDLDVAKLEAEHGSLTAMTAETYVNRVKTSDRQQKNLLDFIRA